MVEFKHFIVFFKYLILTPVLIGMYGGFTDQFIICLAGFHFPEIAEKLLKCV
jgi:hypothetical protein